MASPAQKAVHVAELSTLEARSQASRKAWWTVSVRTSPGPPVPVSRMKRRQLTRKMKKTRHALTMKEVFHAALELRSPDTVLACLVDVEEVVLLEVEEVVVVVMVLVVVVMVISPSLGPVLLESKVP